MVAEKKFRVEPREDRLVWFTIGSRGDGVHLGEKFSHIVSEFWNLFESVPWAKFSVTSEIEGMIPYWRPKAVLKNDVE